jgi:hypothetical protein
VRLFLLLAAAAVLVRWLFLAITGVTYEDSFISLRYAEHLAHGLGMVYNPGERVFGASTPLYVLFLAGLTRAGLPAVLVAKVVLSLMDGATLFLWCRWFYRRTGRLTTSLFFAILFGLSPLIVVVSISGMETSLALLLLTLALLADQEDQSTVLGISLGLLMLVRPDGALAAAVLLGLRWRRTGRVPWAAAGLAALLLLPWLGIATWYYGSPVPHSIPAKAAAYNIHRPSMLPNLRGTLAQFAPVTGNFGQLWAAFILMGTVIAGVAVGWRTPKLRPLPALFLAWWAYLVIPRTVIFNWYFPILLLPAYLVATLGFDALQSPASLPAQWGWSRRWPRAVLTALPTAMLIWMGFSARTTLHMQRAERNVRERIGLWLRDRTPEDATVALEPIGYIGYFSGRRILDEVGLVSPEMVPLNRRGDGWFGEMLREHPIPYVVERPGYLLRNRTLLSGVKLFANAGEVEEFVANYEPVADYDETDVPLSLMHDYRFVIFARRRPEDARRWRDRLASLGPRQRADLITRSLTGTT